jgi:O-antigen/teichoic acid export membrane protein
MKKTKNNGLLKSGSIVIAFTGLGYILNYLFTLIAIRYLEPTTYADMAVIFSLYALVGIFSSTLSIAALSKLTMKDNREEKESVLATAKVLVIALSLLVLLATPFIAKVFSIDSQMSIFIILLAGVLSTGNTLLTVHFQVLKQFIPSGMLGFCSTTIKLFVGFIALWLGYSLLGVSIAMLASALLSFFIFYPRVELPLLSEKNSVDILSKAKQFFTENKSLLIKSFFSSLVLILCVNIDTIVAKKLLSEIDSAQYIGLATLSKIFIYGIVALSTVVFPYILTNSDRIYKKRVFLYFNIFTIIAGVFGSLILYFFGDFFIRLLLGKQYLSNSHELYIIFLSIVAASLAYCASYYASVLDAKNFYLSLVLAIALGIALFSIIPTHTIYSLSVSLASIFAFLYILLYNISIRKSL